MKDKIKIILLALFVLAAIIYNIITKSDFFNKSEDEFIIENKEIVQSISIDNTVSEEISSEVPAKIKIYIAGEVVSPGVYELDENSRIEDAINIAGGLTKDAFLRDVNLACILEDAMKIYIPNKNDNENIEIISGNTTNTTSTSNGININKADASELESIPGIGPSTAQKIITYRNENGKFSSIDDIKNISGIGDKKFESIKEYLSV